MLNRYCIYPCLIFALATAIAFTANGCRQHVCAPDEVVLSGECVKLCGDDPSVCGDGTRFACVNLICTECTAPVDETPTASENCVAYVETLKLFEDGTDLLSSAFTPSDFDYDVTTSIFTSTLGFEFTTQPAAIVDVFFNGEKPDLEDKLVTVGGKSLTEYSATLDSNKILEPQALDITSDVEDWMDSHYTVNVTRGTETFISNPIFNRNTFISPHFGNALILTDSLLIVGHSEADYLPASEEAFNAAGAVHTYTKQNGTWQVNGSELYEKDSAIVAGTDHHFGQAIAYNGGILAVASEDTLYLYRRLSSGWQFLDKIATPAGPGLSTPHWTSSPHGIAMSDSHLAIQVEDTRFGGGSDVVIFDLQGCTGNSCHFGNMTTIEGPGFLSTFGANLAWGNGGWLFVGNFSAGCGSDLENCGVVYAYSQNNNWQSAANIVPPTTTAQRDGDQFGFRVAACGDVLFVSAPFEDSGSTSNPDSTSKPDSGAVFLYRKVGDEWVYDDEYIKAPTIAENDYFGDELACDESHVVVATHGLAGPNAIVEATLNVFSYAESGADTPGFSFQSKPSSDYANGFGTDLSNLALSGVRIAASNILLDLYPDSAQTQNNSGGVFVYE